MSKEEFYELLASDHSETYDPMTGDFYSLDDIPHQQQTSSYEDDQPLPF
jgi:hypothetical protein